MVLLFLGSAIAYALTQNTDRTIKADKSKDYVPASFINSAPANRGLNDYKRDPLKFGQSASTVNNKFEAPQIKVRPLVATKKPIDTVGPVYPFYISGYKDAQKYNQETHEGPVDFWYGVGILKNPLFTGNQVRFGPKWKLKVDLAVPDFNTDIPKAVVRANQLNSPIKTY